MRALSVVLLSCLWLIGCRRGEPETPPSGQPRRAVPEVGFEIGDLAPEIIGQDVDGVEFRLSDYRGKVVVISFWGDW